MKKNILLKKIVWKTLENLRLNGPSGMLPGVATWMNVKGGDYWR
jgi:hypothetical protein